MSNETKEIERLRKWCQEAREIVGLGMKGASKKMEQQINSTAELLKKLSRKKETSDKKLYQSAVQQFQELAAEHKRLAEAHAEAKGKVKELEKRASELEKKAKKNPGLDEAAAKARRLVEQESAKVEQARLDIKELIPKLEELKGNLLADEPLARALHFFELEAGKARKQLEQAGTQPLADTARIQEILDWLDLAQKQADGEQDPKVIEKWRQQLAQMATDLIRKDKTSNKQAQKIDLKQSGAKPEAERLLAEALRLVDELESSGLLEPVVKSQLTQGIEAAEKRVQAEDWLGAKDLLAKLPTREQCQAAHLKAQAESTQEYRPQIEALDQALAALDDLVDADNRVQLLSRRNQLVGAAARGSRRGKEIVETLERFKLLTGELMRLQVTAQEQRNGALLAYGTLSQEVRELDPISPLHRAEENRRLLETLASLRQDQRYAEALQVAESLQRSVSAQDRTAHAEWLKVEPQLRGTTFTVALADARKVKGLPPALLQTLDALELAITPTEVDRLALMRDWATLVARHGEARDFLAGLPQALEAHRQFDGERKKAELTMQKSWTLCDTRLQTLRVSLRTAGVDPAAPLKDLQARLQTLKSEWDDKRINASSLAELELGSTNARIDIWLEAVSGAGDPAQVDDTLQAQRNEQGQRAFNAEADKIRLGELAALRQVSTVMAAEFRAEIMRIDSDGGSESDPTQPWAERLNSLAALGDRVAQANLDEAARCNRINEGLKRQAGVVGQLLVNTQKSLREKLGYFSEKRFGPLFTALDDELQDLIGLTSTGSASAAEANQKLLEALKERILKLQTLVTNSSTMEGTIKAVEITRKALTQLLRDGLEKEAEPTATALSGQFASLEKELFGMEPGAAGEAVTAMNNAVAEARTELDGIQATRLKATTDADGLAQRLKAFAQLGYADALRKSFEKRLKEATAKIADVDQLATALSELGAIDHALKEVEANPKMALQQQSNLLNDEHAAAKQKKEYEQLLKLLEDRDIKRAAEAVKQADGDSAQVTEVERIIALAKKAAKGGSHEQGLQYLTKAALRVQEIERNPQGTALGDRKALPRHASHYGSTIGQLRTALEGFAKQAIALVDPTVREALQKALDPVVARLTQQLNPRLFDLLVGKITAKDAPVADRRAARAEALARLRQARAFITSQPMLRELAVNPVRPVKPEWQAIDISLTRLEAHLRSAIR